ncbi:MAG TPA: hypothetical protein VLI90_17095, partial [Tepidisphaeraceae bacterium]|nr:hypothetical protein [Tepidisphaeraceae bacterium]
PRDQTPAVTDSYEMRKCEARRYFEGVKRGSPGKTLVQKRDVFLRSLGIATILRFPWRDAE